MASGAGRPCGTGPRAVLATRHEESRRRLLWPFFTHDGADTVTVVGRAGGRRKARPKSQLTRRSIAQRALELGDAAAEAGGLAAEHHGEPPSGGKTRAAPAMSEATTC